MRIQPSIVSVTIRLSRCGIWSGRTYPQELELTFKQPRKPRACLRRLARLACYASLEGERPEIEMNWRIWSD